MRSSLTIRDRWMRRKPRPWRSDSRRLSVLPEQLALAAEMESRVRSVSLDPVDVIDGDELGPSDRPNGESLRVGDGRGLGYPLWTALRIRPGRSSRGLWETCECVGLGLPQRQQRHTDDQRVEGQTREVEVAGLDCDLLAQRSPGQRAFGRGVPRQEGESKQCQVDQIDERDELGAAGMSDETPRQAATSRSPAHGSLGDEQSQRQPR